MTTVLLAGATGLIGAQVLQDLLASAAVGHVHVVSRRALPQTHAKLTVHVLPLSDWSSWQVPASVDVGISCLGTTLRQAGSQAAFRAVDQDAVLALADLALAAGAHRFLSVSAIGVSPQARTFYNRVKGEVEQALSTRTGAHGFHSLVLLQPSLLTGAREEFRLGERAADWLLRPLAPLLRGRWADYRPIAAHTVARALVAAALAPGNEFSGVVRLTGRALTSLSQGAL